MTRALIIRILSLLAAISCIPLAGAGPVLPADRDDPKNRNQKALYVTVQRGSEQLIGGLRERNFRVRIDGEPVDFAVEEPEKPAAVALLVEYSRGSWFYVRDIVNAMQGFVNAAPEGNWYALATFAHELNIAQDFTKQRGKISQAFSTLSAPNWNDVDTYDAIYQMLDRMDRMRGRKVLIFIGAGFDTFSSRTLGDVMNKAESADVTVFTLGAGSMLRGTYDRYLGTLQRLDVMQAQNFLQSLADKTGGWARFPRFEQAFPDVMKGIMQMLQSQYKLVYDSPPPADDFQEVEVEAFALAGDEREDFQVYVREGWRY